MTNQGQTPGGLTPDDLRKLRDAEGSSPGASADSDAGDLTRGTSTRFGLEQPLSAEYKSSAPIESVTDDLSPVTQSQMERSLSGRTRADEAGHASTFYPGDTEALMARRGVGDVLLGGFRIPLLPVGLGFFVLGALLIAFGIMSWNTTSAPVATAGGVTVQPIKAEFNQPQFSTYYRLTAPPDWTVQWSADIDGCGLFIDPPSLEALRSEQRSLMQRGSNLSSGDRARLQLISRVTDIDPFMKPSVANESVVRWFHDDTVCTQSDQPHPGLIRAVLRPSASAFTPDTQSGLTCEYQTSLEGTGRGCSAGTVGSASSSPTGAIPVAAGIAATALGAAVSGLSLYRRNVVGGKHPDMPQRPSIPESMREQMLQDIPPDPVDERPFKYEPPTSRPLEPPQTPRQSGSGGNFRGLRQVPPADDSGTAPISIDAVPVIDYRNPDGTIGGEHPETPDEFRERILREGPDSPLRPEDMPKSQPPESDADEVM